MRNKITIHFDSIDLLEARTFYNKVRNKVIELFTKESFIKNLKTKLNCNLY